MPNKLIRWRYETPDGEIIGISKRGPFYKDKPYKVCYYNGSCASILFVPDESDMALSFATEQEAQEWLDDYADGHGYRVVVPKKRTWKVAV